MWKHVWVGHFSISDFKAKHVAFTHFLFGHITWLLKLCCCLDLLQSHLYYGGFFAGVTVASPNILIWMAESETCNPVDNTMYWPYRRRSSSSMVSQEFCHGSPGSHEPDFHDNATQPPAKEHLPGTFLCGIRYVPGRIWVTQLLTHHFVFHGSLLIIISLSPLSPYYSMPNSQ